jgi:hypothetical protein
MKKVSIFILLALFAGLSVYGGQPVNGPGIREFASYEYKISDFPAAEIAIGAVPADGLTGVSPVIASIGPITIPAVSIPLYNQGIIPASMTDGSICCDKDYGVFECIMLAYPDIRKGGVLSFDGGMRPGI